MNIEDRQKAEESCYLKEFLKRMEIRPEHINPGEEPPDYYIVCGSNTIAVELTEYHSMGKSPSGHPWRVVEEECQKIRDLFTEKRKQYSALDDVHGNLFFRELQMPPARSHCQFVTELLDFAISQHRTLTRERTRFDSFPPEFPLLNKYLKMMDLRKVNCYLSWDWANAAWVGITEEGLEKCVLKKLKNQRPVRPVSENWLLIVSGALTSQQIGLPHCEDFNDFAALNSSLQKNPYDKVFFFQYMWGRILCWSRDEQWKEVKSAVLANATAIDLQ